MRIRLLSGLFLLAFAPELRADLVTHWNFNSYDGNAATIVADSGNGVVVLRENGAAWSADLLDAASGTNVNAFALDLPGTALALDNDGDELVTRTMTFGLSTTGFENLTFSAALAGSNSSFDTGLLSYSLDGASFTETGLTVDPSSSGSFEQHTVDLSSFSILDNQASLFIRLTLTGTNLNPNQQLLVDNVQILATAGAAAVPEPASLRFASIAGAVGLLAVRRRRKK